MEVDNERQKRLDYHKTYYQVNKVKLLEEGKRNVYCGICNNYHQNYNFLKHLTTKRHIMMETRRADGLHQRQELLDKVISMIKWEEPEPIDELGNYKHKLFNDLTTLKSQLSVI